MTYRTLIPIAIRIKYAGENGREIPIERLPSDADVRIDECQWIGLQDAEVGLSFDRDEVFMKATIVGLCEITEAMISIAKSLEYAGQTNRFQNLLKEPESSSLRCVPFGGLEQTFHVLPRSPRARAIRDFNTFGPNASRVVDPAKTF